MEEKSAMGSLESKPGIPGRRQVRLEAHEDWNPEQKICEILRDEI